MRQHPENKAVKKSRKVEAETKDLAVIEKKQGTLTGLFSLQQHNPFFAAKNSPKISHWRKLGQSTPTK